MFGFFTILAFVIAWQAGGWWWLVAIVMGLAWSGKLQQENAKAASASLPVGESVLDPAVDVDRSNDRTQSKQLDGTNDWVIKLTDICSSYWGRDFYVGELIPEQKLKNATKTYPLPDGGRVVALIDTTVFGTAGNGLLIGEYGLSWHNFATETKISSLRWREFSETALLLDGSKIKFGNFGIFDTAGSSFGKGKIIGLLVAIQIGYADYSKGMKPAIMNFKSVEKRTVDVNRASYEDLLTLPGVGAAEAKMILARRESTPFSSLDSLTHFLDLKPHKADQLKNLVIFSVLDRSPDVRNTDSPPTIFEVSNQDVPSPAVEKPVKISGGRIVD